MSSTVRNLMEAMIDAIRIEMRRDPTVIYLGEGTGERGGTFGHTLGLYQEFGPRRMIDTPISELGYTGACIGAAAAGCRPIADLMFADFLAEAMSQIVNQAAKLRYMSNGQVSVPLVVWAGIGAIKSAGPHHSGCLYPWFMHVPGLKVVIPATPADAKGLYAAAIRDDDPVLFMAHKMLFTRKGPVPDGEYVVPIGKAARVREGRHATIAGTALMTHLALEAAEKLSAAGVECDVIDLRTLAPLDVDTILASVARTGRLLVVDEAYGPCGVGAEIAARVMEQGFDLLDAPVLRLHTASVSHPFSPVFDPLVLPQMEQIMDKVRLLLAGGPACDVVAVSKAAGAPTLASAPQTHDGAGAAAQRDGGDAAPAHAGRTGIVIPNQGLTVSEALITTWRVGAGQRIRKGQPLFEIETDKATMDVEADADGILEEIVAPAGSTVPLGALVAYLRPAENDLA
jgi:2-oxoisovalerate dehydrogenase E1 component